MHIDTLKMIVSEHEKLQIRIDTQEKNLKELEDSALIAGGISYLDFRAEENAECYVQLQNTEIGVQSLLLFLTEKLEKRIASLKKRQDDMMRECDL